MRPKTSFRWYDPLYQMCIRDRYNLQRYQSKVSNLLLENFIGFTVDLSGTVTQAVIVYQNPDTVLHFPIVYGNEWTSATTYGLDLAPAGQNILYEAIQTRETRVDGWGTLMTLSLIHI